MGFCPECGAAYEPAVVACPRCRVALVAEPPPAPGAPEVIFRVPDAVSGALLQGMLEHHGVAALLRSAALPAYGSVPRDWSTSAWARALIAEYLQMLERGGQVRDEDVEAEEDGGGAGGPRRE
ncbi:MAG: hypothetical protein E6K81_16850 [Candidatus Eisenbacteria bacterium]|uniref:DUF2007 domain-containing protein n=1 Tax=Eiseniibacteriota bacterium TaxID=2212470 RepID=A0A538TWI5_UNCEI|nr:MAG: hypothetical protein E6K81_16850 [Candidatus Eisenbacteria bacterium]